MSVPSARIASVRQFSRFYTAVLGLLQQGLLDTPYSLTEARAIFELAQRSETELSDLREALNLDAGYLSRIINSFEKKGLVRCERSTEDARRQVLRLTRKGRGAFGVLDRRSAGQVETLLSRLNDDQQQRLVAAMRTIEEILGHSPPPRAVVFRPPHPGDFGWVVQRHGSLYTEEFGWNETFEALVARVVADYIEHPEPERQAGWIAEVDNERAGCVFCMQKTKNIAQLRLLLVDPTARGLGLGSRLVAECISFAKRNGYKQMTLWTNDVLHSARRIYERAGFELRDENKHHSFGHELVGQDWWLDL